MRQAPISSRPRGFTLVELLMTLAIATVLLTLAISSLGELVASTKITNAANSLVAHFQYARTEALKRSAPVILCPSADGVACNTGASSSIWTSGYLVGLVDAASPPQLTQVLRRVDGAELRSLSVSSGGRTRFTLQGDGTAFGANGTLTICDSANPSRKRAVILSPIGRVRVSNFAAGGGGLACP